MSSSKLTDSHPSISHFQDSAEFHRVGAQIKELCSSIHDLGEVVRKEILAFVDEAGEAWMAKHHPHAPAASPATGNSSASTAQEGNPIGEEGKQGDGK